MFEKSWKYGKDRFHALLISKMYNMIAFLSLEGSEENGVDGQLLYAIKAFYDADRSFVDK